MPRVKSRTIAKHYATLHPYDVVVYQENGHYYAKSASRLICVDSPTSCLQEAVNYLSNGGRIYIKKGNYNISNTVTVGPNIEIHGEATLIGPPDTTIINIKNARDVRIEKITVLGGQHGILVTNSQRVEIEGVRVLGSGLYGVYIYDSSLVDLLNSYIENTQECGIAVESYLTEVYGISIRNNKIINAGQSKRYCGNGIHLESHRSITDVDIEGNYVNGAGLAGISVMTSQRVGIRDNVILNSGLDGVIIIATSYSKIIGNIIANNGRNNNAGYQNGIRIDDPGVNPPSTYNIVAENVIINNPGQAIVERGNANFNTIINNITIGNGTPQVITTGPNTVVINTVGHVTRASGRATIQANSTSVTVNHGLTCTPSKVLVTPTTDVKAWVSNVTDTSLTINIDVAQLSSVTVYWYAEC